ncbi:MAG: hypothetical protein Q4C34_07200 [Bacteroidales bacterium]|nr:hypothetical protein [Bacteroidales bacterium]
MTNQVSEFTDGLGASLKSVVKMLLQSRPVCPPPHGAGERVIVLANGPSLNDTIARHRDIILRTPAIAVNFFANTPYFAELHPRYYVLADPHFFTAVGNDNVDRLWESIARADWPMTLCVPVSRLAETRRRLGDRGMVSVATFNPVGVEGFPALERLAFSKGWGMPRPRNVLIPSIMVAIAAGYKKIYLTGTDHSWLETIRVTDANHVVSVQPHFYEDSTSEHERITTEYKGYRLHDILHSFYTAFRSYHAIERYARRAGIEIYNATPGSYIDAFERRSLDD